MDSGVIYKLFAEEITGSNCKEKNNIETQIETTDAFEELKRIEIAKDLKYSFDHYRVNYEEYDIRGLDRLNSKILRLGYTLKQPIELFHGCANKLSLITPRPISFSTHPSKAIWHARKHRSFELNGQCIYIYGVKFERNALFKCCVDFNDEEFGHEYELLFQSGLRLCNISEVKIFENVYYIECTARIA